MARFNTQKQTTKTTNLAGGQAYKESPELELVSLLFTSFVNDKFYEKANDNVDRLKNLIQACDKKFVAQAAIYARTKFGMRSITHIAASELAKHIGSKDWGARHFYDKVINRPDDMVEIMAYHLKNNGKPSKAMINGFAAAFNKFDGYQLAKYRSEGKDIKLVDIVNMVHPKPTEKNKKALQQLIKGDLKSSGTWESELTKAGQQAETKEQKDEFKKDAWTRLIKEKKIGYFALLRNLRNVIEQAPDALSDALNMLVDEKIIKKSLVMPFNFTTAYDEIEKLGSAGVRETLVALNKAIDISVSNAPKFEGQTLVVLDVSASMLGKASQIGSLFAAVLLKANNCDFITFDTYARYINYNPNDSTITLAKQFRFIGDSTNFHSIFTTANKKYDRIIILSDMQGWVGYHTPVNDFNLYKSKFNCNPFVYSFDLNGYGTLQFPEQKVFALAGFSDKVFDLMGMLETDKNAMINEIKKIEL